MPRACPAYATYQRRQPEQTVLYQTIATHLPAFLARRAAKDGSGGWPALVRREFAACLRCGRLQHGFRRARCERCGDTVAVAFSCKRRAFCPSCGGRRMSELAAYRQHHGHSAGGWRAQRHWSSSRARLRWRLHAAELHGATGGPAPAATE